MVGETLQVYRGTGTGDNGTDKHGNVTRAADHVVSGIFAWGSSGKGTSRFSTQNERQESATVTAQLYVPRTSDLKQRDRIKRGNGEWYVVTGHSLWDMDQPQTGRNFAWKLYQVEGTV